MAFTNTFDTATPAGSDDPAEADDRMQEIKKAVQEREDVDHYWPLTGTEVSDAAGGEHRKITIRTLTPTEVAALTATKAYLYRLSTDGELYFKDDDDNTIQLTIGGVIKLTSAALLGILANDTYLTAVDAAGTGTVNLIQANPSDQAVIGTSKSWLPDTSSLYTSAAPTLNAQIANKKYVDNQCDAHIGAAGQWHHDGTSVHNGNSPTSYTDLDLSSYCGSNRALVFLKIKNNGVGNSYFFRTNGDTELVGEANAAWACGCSASRIDPGEITYIIVETDASGIVEWDSLIATSTQVWIMGYVK